MPVPPPAGGRRRGKLLPRQPAQGSQEKHHHRRQEQAQAGSLQQAPEGAVADGPALQADSCGRQAQDDGQDDPAPGRTAASELDPLGQEQLRAVAQGRARRGRGHDPVLVQGEQRYGRQERDRQAPAQGGAALLELGQVRLGAMNAQALTGKPGIAIKHGAAAASAIGGVVILSAIRTGGQDRHC